MLRNRIFYRNKFQKESGNHMKMIWTGQSNNPFSSIKKGEQRTHSVYGMIKKAFIDEIG